MKFGLFKYNTVNIGDEVQSLAAKQFLPRVDRYIDREDIDGSGVISDTKLIMNGWFMHNSNNWPFTNDHVQPLLTSFHINNPGMLKDEAVVFYKKYGQPIGCRDRHTQNLLEAKGIDAYFSGCLTLTLKNRFNYRTNGIYIVDVNPEIKAFIPKGILNAQFLSHVVSKKKAEDGDYKFNLAQEYLDKYAKAKFVITSRLHCALPCLAFGTPVLFIPENIKDVRYEGLLEYLNHCSIDDLKSGTYTIDFDNPMPNPKDISPLRDPLIRTCIDFIGHDYYSDRARMKEDMPGERYLIVKGTAGFGNRMQSFCNGLVLSKLLNRKLVVDWRDGMYAEQGEDSFCHFFENKHVQALDSDNFLSLHAKVPGIFPYEWSGFENKSVNSMITILAENLGTERRDVVLPARDTLSFSFEKEYPENKDLMFYDYSFDEVFYKKQRSHLPENMVHLDKGLALKYMIAEELKFKEDIVAASDQFLLKWKDKKVIGVHIRYTDNLNKRNWTELLYDYFVIIDRIMGNHRDDYVIYVATDNRGAIDVFSKRYRNVVWHEKRFPEERGKPIHHDPLIGDRVQMGKDALIEMLSLSKCDYIIGSKKSSFMGISSILADKKKSLLYDIDSISNNFACISHGVSIICAVKDRGSNLKKSITSWLAHDEVSEIIIVDWNSKEPVRDTLSAFLDDKRIRIVEAKNQPHWILSKAYNLAARFVNTYKILKLDADVIHSPDFFRKNMINTGLFFRGNWRISRNKNENHLSGTVFVNKNDFTAVGGYNEFISTYGYDDVDLYERLSAHGVVGKDFDLNTLYHTPHDDYQRLIHQPKVRDITRENLNNFRLSKKIIWNKKRVISKYRIVRVTETLFEATEYATASAMLWIFRKAGISLKFYRTLRIDIDMLIGLAGIQINRISPALYQFLIRKMKRR